MRKLSDAIDTIPPINRHIADAGIVGSWLVSWMADAKPYFNFAIGLLTIVWLSLQIYGWIERRAKK